MNNKHLETIVNGLEPIALIIKADFHEDGLHFFAPGSFSQQVAYMKHPAGKKSSPMFTDWFQGRFYILKKFY